jgi:hypothetical protein
MEEPWSKPVELTSASATGMRRIAAVAGEAAAPEHDLAALGGGVELRRRVAELERDHGLGVA